MKRTLLYSTVALVLVLGLTLTMVMPLMAHGIGGDKFRSPDKPFYDVGETIHYVMVVRNPVTNLATNNLTNIWDVLPDDSTHWFVQGGMNPPLIQTPGQNNTYYLDYVVDWHDAEYSASLGYYIVRNTFQVQGVDSDGLPVGYLVQDVAGVNPPPPVGGEAFPVSKLSILAPWIALGAAIMAGAAIFVRRRHVRS